MERVSIGDTGRSLKPGKGINAETLKIIALISMTVYSIGNSFIDGMYLNMQIIPHTPLGAAIYYLFIILGAPSFVLFTFLITEGFRHTSDRKAYIIRLLAAAVLSELPFDLFYSGTGNLLLQNILFSYIIAFITLWIIDNILNKTRGNAENKAKMSRGAAILLICLAALVGLLTAELIRGFYGIMVVAMALVFYFFREKKSAVFIGGLITFFAGFWVSRTLSDVLSIVTELKLKHIVKYSFTVNDLIAAITANIGISAITTAGAVLGLLLIMFYNGKKGYAHPKIFYYLYFPLHMLLLVFVCFILMLLLQGMR